MEESMLDQTTALAAQLDADVKALVAALATANSNLAAANSQITQLQSQIQSDASAADQAGVALLQPIANEAAAALPPEPPAAS
jgi:ABC-type transporter Mla subunit MlaD